MKAIRHRISTNEFVQDEYPRKDMQPLDGLDPDYEYLVFRKKIPEYDSSKFTLKEELPVEFPQDEEFPHLRKYEITYELVPVVEDTRNWHHPQYALRIVAPITLVMSYPQFYIWFLVNNLPVEKSENTLYLYCNEILPEHQVFVDNLKEIITIEKY